MSRRSRGFIPRWGLTTFGPEKKFSTVEKVEYLNRAVKRMNKAAGHQTAKQPSKWKYGVDGEAGTVEAHTRSEARALIKKEIGLKKKDRLPVGILLEKVNE